MHENKRQVVEAYLPVLRMTNAGSSVKSLVYHMIDLDEYVTIFFENGYEKRVCVTADSCIAIINAINKAVM